MDPDVLFNMNKTNDVASYLKCVDRVLVNPPLAHYHTYYDLMCFFGFPSKTIDTIERSANGLRAIAKGLRGPAHVNGALFYFFPTTEVYLNRWSYCQRFGTCFYFPNWWRESSAIAKQIINNPSRNFSFFNLYEWYEANFPEICTSFYEQSAQFEVKPFFAKRFKEVGQILERIKQLRAIGKQLIREATDALYDPAYAPDDLPIVSLATKANTPSR